MYSQISLDINKAGYGESSFFAPIQTTFHTGKCSVLVGPGGSGKTTLLKLLGGLNSLEKEFWFEGNIINPFSKIFLLPQHFSKDQVFRIDQNDIDRSKSFFAFSNLLINEIEKNQEISYEEMAKPTRKLLFLVKFLVSKEFLDTPLLLLDEPEFGLNELLQEELIRIINFIKVDKVVVISSHHVSFTRSVADQVIYIKYGNMVYQAETESFFNAQNEDVQYLINMGC